MDKFEVFAEIFVVIFAIFFTYVVTNASNKIGHKELGSAGHTCFANHTCRENLTCHYGFGDSVGICLGVK